ncbi:DUF4942 domain-containing protein [Acidovorax sp.]|uniref:DUF4942 domain-containing protein n=1 Tax=Acidovorax sp. TaxID=1872122 RepID=UPI00391F1976
MQSHWQYYPTGVHTTARMFGKLKRPVVHFCDPSAGKGHLIRHAREGFPGVDDADLPWLAEYADEDESRGPLRHSLRHYARHKFSDLKNVSAVEIDPAHHASLKELGAKILGYDFLEVSSLATVSTLMMNPPFQAGCAHVLHAWDVLYDAELVAIINAETLRNPYTRDRQRLVDLIAAHGSVEYLEDQFTDDVERTTNVEVALIYLDKVPAKYLDVDAMLGDLQRGDNEAADADPEVCTALALPSNFIEDTCFRFRQAVAAARKSSETTAVADHLRNALGLTLDEMQAKGLASSFREASDSVRQVASEDFANRYADLKKRAWGQILRSSLLSDRISNEARKRLEASAASIYELAFTPANIHGLLHGVVQSMSTIYADMIDGVFTSIIGRSSENAVFYKSWASNQKHRIGMRVRKTRFILPNFKLGHNGCLEYETAKFLQDIDLAFGYLLGLPPDYEGLVAGYSRLRPESGERIETTLFGMRVHRGVGTCHIYPRDQATMDKLNLFVGRHRNWIPGDMSEANEDFKKQYDKAESLTDAYVALEKEGRRNGPSYHHSTRSRENRFGYQLLREIEGLDSEGEYKYSLDRLEKAIEGVHEAQGLRCGPALASGAPVMAISAAPDVSGQSKGAQPEQLLLLAA